jgi:hypothetical protein
MRQGSRSYQALNFVGGTAATVTIDRVLIRARLRYVRRLERDAGEG